MPVRGRRTATPYSSCCLGSVVSSHSWPFYSCSLVRFFVFWAGPRDDEFAGKKFSFVRYSSICAIIPDSKSFEDAAREAGAVQAEIDKVAGSGSGLVF